MKTGPSVGEGGHSETTQRGHVEIWASVILQVLDHEQQMERKKTIQVGAKRSAESLSDKWEKQKRKQLKGW